MFRTSRLLVFLLLSLSAVAASGLNNRSAVSVNGSDTNPCTAMSPCRSFVAALAATNPGGEVIALDSGGYGTFVVNKSVSVIGAPGIHAAITVASGKGIDVSTASLDIVTIRNINITATSSDADGISATMFYHLSIEGCHVSGGGHGIVITGPTYSMASIVDTVVQGASYGFFIVRDSTSRRETQTPERYPLSILWPRAIRMVWPLSRALPGTSRLRAWSARCFPAISVPARTPLRWRKLELMRLSGFQTRRYSTTAVQASLSWAPRFLAP